MQLRISAHVMHSSGILSLDERSPRYPKCRVQWVAVDSGLSAPTAGWVWTAVEVSVFVWT